MTKPALKVVVNNTAPEGVAIPRGANDIRVLGSTSIAKTQAQEEQLGLADFAHLHAQIYASRSSRRPCIASRLDAGFR